MAAGYTEIVIGEGTCIRVAPKVYRALGNDSKNVIVYRILGAVPSRAFRLAAELCWETASRTERKFRDGRKLRRRREIRE